MCNNYRDLKFTLSHSSNNLYINDDIINDFFITGKKNTFDMNNCIFIDDNQFYYFEYNQFILDDHDIQYNFYLLKISESGMFINLKENNVDDLLFVLNCLFCYKCELVKYVIYHM